MPIHTTLGPDHWHQAYSDSLRPIVTASASGPHKQLSQCVNTADMNATSGSGGTRVNKDPLCCLHVATAGSHGSLSARSASKGIRCLHQAHNIAWLRQDAYNPGTSHEGGQLYVGGGCRGETTGSSILAQHELPLQGHILEALLQHMHEGPDSRPHRDDQGR